MSFAVDFGGLPAKPVSSKGKKVWCSFSMHRSLHRVYNPEVNAMPVRITGRQVEITRPIREYIEKKITRIEKYTDRVQSIDIVIDKNRYNHKVEFRMKAGPIAVNANIQDPELTRAIDLLMDKVERQLSKKTEKLRDRKSSARKSLPPAVELPEAELEPIAANGNVATARKQRKQKQSRQQPARNARVQPVLAENVGVHIFQNGTHLCREMDVHDAAEELFFNDENFFCFQDTESGRLSIIYRRKDSNFGVIELAAE
jgi:putative sigma-54 modulation protein